MDAMADELNDAARRWQSLAWPQPRVMVVAGSGLELELGRPTHGPLPLSDFLPFAAEGVKGHRLAVELLLPRGERPVLYFRGRLHAYQGYTPAQVVFGLRLGALLGARVLLMSNAAGGLDPGHRPGDLLLIRDHINLTGLNPLRGSWPDDWGSQFPDMADAYDEGLRELAQARGADVGVPLGEGIYAGLLGPSYETPAEVAMLRHLGADLVGMSTVLEVIAAHHMGVRCMVLSVVTNTAAGAAAATDHDTVLTIGRQAADRVQKLFAALLSDPELLEE